jgi:hypothetical protein
MAENTTPALVQFNNCFVRYQNPLQGQTATQARITRLNWPTSPEDVARTINDYGNGRQQNVQLFLKGGIGALNYAGYLNSCIISQSDLNKDNTQISILLPSGVAKITAVTAPPELLGQNNQVVTGIYGINTGGGQLEPTDWAYTTGAQLKTAIATWEALERANRESTLFKQATLNLASSDRSPIVLIIDGLIIQD